MGIPMEILRLFMIESVLSIETLVKKKNLTVYYLQSKTGAYVLKSVSGQAKVNRLFNEVDIFKALSITNFEKYAKPVTSINKKIIEADCEFPGLYWYVIKYIPNKQDLIKDFVTGAELGRSVAELHSLSLNIDSLKPTRANEIKANIDFLIDEGYRDLLYNKNLILDIDRMNKIPRSFIHGDLNFGNIIWTKINKFMFIDFEFSRYDLRIFDLATLLSPQINDENKVVEVMPIEFKNGLLSGYSEIIQLSKDELDYIESASIIYWLLVLIDTKKSNGVSTDLIHNILKILTERLS